MYTYVTVAVTDVILGNFRGILSAFFFEKSF